MKQSSVNVWSTQELAKSDRYPAWVSALNSAYGRWAPCKPESADFFGSVRHYNDDDILRVIECACDPCAATRARADIRADGLETLTVQLVLDGLEEVNFNGEEITLKRDDLLVWDSTQPMTFRVRDRLHKISVVLPLARFQSWLPRSWFSIRHSIDGSSNGGRLLASHLKALSTSVFNGGCKDNHALVDSTIGMLVNALPPVGDAVPTPLRVTQLRHVKDYIRARLRDPALSPAMIAKSGGMSLRYLHWLFNSTGETVKQHIFRQRLECCARDLLNPRMMPRKIADIAFHWGFQDLAHFNKRFKQEYQLTPGAFRKKTQGADL